MNEFHSALIAQGKDTLPVSGLLTKIIHAPAKAMKRDPRGLVMEKYMTDRTLL